MMKLILYTILAVLSSFTRKSKSDYNLTCYVCDTQFPNTKLYQIDQCQLPNSSISQLVPIFCNPFEDACMVKRFAKNGITSALIRKCSTSDNCLGDRGCKFTNYGITTWECTSCCFTPACNTDNNANNFQLFLFLYLINFSFSFFISF